LTELEIKEAELKQMIETNNTGMTIEQAIIYLSKWIGYRLNPREITVTEYFNILSEYGKANKKD
jgi:predicted metal-dependent TIM-barrel fold hydrolase